MTVRRVIPVLLACAVSGVAAAQPRTTGPVPRDRIEDAIREGCERIMATQRPDGAFVLDERRFGPGGDYVYPLGVVSLGVLALQHALPHLKGDTASRAREAVRMGLAWITQHALETKTYSAGLAVCVLHMDHPDKHRKLIGDYAAMLILSQHREGLDTGAWGYDLHLPPRLRARENRDDPARLGRMDHSNTQFAALGLLFAHYSDFQIPTRTWRLLRKHYLDLQNEDGGWGYRSDARPGSYANMTLASTISLAICEEMLLAGDHSQCKAPPESGPVNRGINWISRNVDYDALETYGFYALERLGILSGLSEFGGKPWFDEGASRLVTNRRWQSHGASSPNQQVGAAFAVLFLSRGLEPIIINKLKRRDTDDWNNDPYDVKHLVEYISSRFQRPKQWRLVTLDADVDFLLRVPILYINGHDALQFTDVEKARLKEYVERGGMLFGMACCGRKPFDESFRALLTELWPGGELVPLPKTHEIYHHPRPLTVTQKLLGLYLKQGQGRLGVVYSPHDLCCRWHKGGSRAKSVFDVGTNLFFYVDKIAPGSTVGTPAAAVPPMQKE